MCSAIVGIPTPLTPTPYSPIPLTLSRLQLSDVRFESAVNLDFRAENAEKFNWCLVTPIFREAKNRTVDRESSMAKRLRNFQELHCGLLHKNPKADMGNEKNCDSGFMMRFVVPI